MNHGGKNFSIRNVIAGASMMAAMFAGAPVFAQPQAITVATVSTGDAAQKAQSIISKPGSYVLNKNIVNGKTSADSVQITASNVTLDLQGFSITATAASTGAAINASGQSNVVIRNGIITGFGGPAIVTGTAAKISGMTVTGNGSGITCGVGCLARDNVIQGNSGIGMTFSDTTSGFLGNVLQGNSGNTVGATGQISGGTSLGQNVCNGLAC